jgi:hypothetical protein
VTVKQRIRFLNAALLCSLLLLPAIVGAQGTLADYERALGLRDRVQKLALNIPDRANWIEKTSRFWYRRSVKGGSDFVLVDADTAARRPAFDHEKIAASLSAAAAGKYTALMLPLTSIRFIDAEQAIEFAVSGTTWRCTLLDYALGGLLS